MASLWQAVASENKKKSKTYKPEAEPPRQPDREHMHLLELVRSQGLAMSLLLSLQNVCCYCRKERAPTPPTPNVDWGEKTGQGLWEERGGIVRTVGAYI